MKRTIDVFEHFIVVEFEESRRYVHGGGNQFGIISLSSGKVVETFRSYPDACVEASKLDRRRGGTGRILTAEQPSKPDTRQPEDVVAYVPRRSQTGLGIVAKGCGAQLLLNLLALLFTLVGFLIHPGAGVFFGIAFLMLLMGAGRGRKPGGYGPSEAGAAQDAPGGDGV
jgi:hypothetical protein